MLQRAKQLNIIAILALCLMCSACMALSVHNAQKPIAYADGNMSDYGYSYTSRFDDVIDIGMSLEQTCNLSFLAKNNVPENVQQYAYSNYYAYLRFRLNMSSQFVNNYFAYMIYNDPKQVEHTGVTLSRETSSTHMYSLVAIRSIAPIDYNSLDNGLLPSNWRTWGDVTTYQFLTDTLYGMNKDLMGDEFKSINYNEKDAIVYLRQPDKQNNPTSYICEMPFYMANVNTQTQYYYSFFVLDSNDVTIDLKDYNTVVSTQVKKYERALNAVSSNKAFSYADLSRRYLEAYGDQIDPSVLSTLQAMINEQPSTATIPVTVRWKILDSGVCGEDIKTVMIPSNHAHNAKLAWEDVCNVSSVYNISEYNVNRIDIITTTDGNGITRSAETVLQAKGYEYTYDPDAEQGAINITYEDFKYSQFALHLRSNTPYSDDNLIYLDLSVKTADVEQNGSTYTLKYDYAYIYSVAKANTNWLFDLLPENIAVNGVQLHAGESANVNGVVIDVMTQNNDNMALTLTFDADNQNALSQVYLVITADIEEDVPIEWQYRYKQLVYNSSSGEYREDVTADKDNYLYSSNYTAMLSVVRLLGDPFALNFYNNYGIVIEDAINPEGLNVQPYVYKGIKYSESDKDGDGKIDRALITVEYNIVPIFRLIYRTVDGEVLDVALKETQNTNYYTCNTLGVDVPTGYRIADLVADENVVVEKSERNMLINSLFTVTRFNDITTIRITLTDKWQVNIEYLVRYVNEEGDNTPFARRIKVTKDVRVADYGQELSNLTVQNLCSILNVNTLNVLKSRVDDALVIEYDAQSDVYNIHPTYSLVSIKTIDINGNDAEMKVPLASYADWLALYGTDYSIMMLNTENRRYFAYANDVKAEDLYGYFFAAFFAEPQVNLNHVFRTETGAGVSVIHKSAKIKGSSLYRFVSDSGWTFAAAGAIIGTVVGHPIAGAVIGEAAKIGLLALCELDNDNREVYSYYGFYDPELTSDKPYISTGGASSADDTDPAITNAIQSAGNSFKNVWKKLQNSTLYTVLQVLFWVAVAGLTIVFIAWVIRKVKG